MSFLLIILIVIFVFLLLFLRRNHKAYKEVKRTLALFDELYNKEISEGKGFDRWRYELLDTIDYYEVVLTFWKPVKSFYDLDWYNKPKKEE